MVFFVRWFVRFSCKKRVKGSHNECPALLGPGRVAWTHDDVKKVASRIAANLPPAIHEIVNSGDWKGGRLFFIDSLLTWKYG